MALKEEKILLVEDDPDHAELITSVLKEDDTEHVKTEIILKKDGQEAIDYFQHEAMPQVSLVILDLNLPKVDGMDVLKFAKNNSRYCSVPIIVFSTSSNQETIDEAYKNGANSYFIKPNSYEDFVVKIKILKKSLLRFGKIAVDMGFVTAKQLDEALSEQADDDLSSNPHRLIGSILLENGWMTKEQIDMVLNELFKKEKRNE